MHNKADVHTVQSLVVSLLTFKADRRQHAGLRCATVARKSLLVQRFVRSHCRDARR
jgi:hypothetical protein